MKTKEEIRDWLLENAINEIGDLMLSDLDFSNFDGDVVISGMKVKRDLYQSYQEVRGNLIQDGHEVKGDLFQGYHKVKGDLFQSNLKVEGECHCNNVQVEGDIFADEFTKPLKEVTAEELAEMDYKLKGGN